MEKENFCPNCKAGGNPKVVAKGGRMRFCRNCGRMFFAPPPVGEEKPVERPWSPLYAS